MSNKEREHACDTCKNKCKVICNNGANVTYCPRYEKMSKIAISKELNKIAIKDRGALIT